MNKTENSKYIERINGEIIGGDEKSVRVQLYSPKGTLNESATLYGEMTPREWGEKMLEKIKSQPDGHGNPIGDDKSRFEETYGAGKWEIRIFND